MRDLAIVIRPSKNQFDTDRKKPVFSGIGWQVEHAVTGRYIGRIDVQYCTYHKTWLYYNCGETTQPDFWSAVQELLARRAPELLATVEQTEHEHAMIEASAAFWEADTSWQGSYYPDTFWDAAQQEDMTA